MTSGWHVSLKYIIFITWQLTLLNLVLYKNMFINIKPESKAMRLFQHGFSCSSVLPIC